MTSSFICIFWSLVEFSNPSKIIAINMLMNMKETRTMKVTKKPFAEPLCPQPFGRPPVS